MVISQDRERWSLARIRAAGQRHRPCGIFAGWACRWQRADRPSRPGGDRTVGVRARLSCPSTLLLVTHDRRMINAVHTRVNAMRPLWASPAPRPMPPIASCSPTCCGPMAGACRSWPRPRGRRWTCRPCRGSRGNLVATRTSLTNQLLALPEAHWPGAARLFNNLQSWLLLRSLRTNIELLIRVRRHPAQVPKGRARVRGSADSVRTPRSDSRSRPAARHPRGTCSRRTSSSSVDGTVGRLAGPPLPPRGAGAVVERGRGRGHGRRRRGPARTGQAPPRGGRLTAGTPRPRRY